MNTSSTGPHNLCWANILGLCLLLVPAAGWPNAIEHPTKRLRHPETVRTEECHQISEYTLEV